MSLDRKNEISGTGWKKCTIKDPVKFPSPLREKENVILPWHMKQLQQDNIPDWARNQETWIVEKIFHQTSEAIIKADIAILTPASQDLGDIVA